jgi:hypothetical protein
VAAATYSRWILARRFLPPDFGGKIEMGENKEK